MSQEIGVGGAKLGLCRGAFEVVITQAFKGGADVSDMSRGVEVEDDDVVGVGGDVVEVFDDLVDDIDKPPAGAALLPWSMTSHSKSRVGVQRR